MATSDQRGTSVLGTNGTTWATTANAVDGTYGNNNATYCTWTNTTSGGSGYIEIKSFDFSAIPSDATISSVVIKPRHYLSASVTRMSSITVQPYDNTTAIGSGLTATKQTSVATDSLSMGTLPTLAQLQSANFKIRMTWVRASVTTACVANLDFIDVTVTYTTPLSGTPTVGSLTVDGVAATGQGGLVGTPTVGGLTADGAEASATLAVVSDELFTDDLEGSNGVALTQYPTGNSEWDTISGAGTSAFDTSVFHVGSSSAKVTCTSQGRILERSYTARGSAWMVFYLRFPAAPSANTVIAQAVRSGSTVAEIRLNTGRTLNIRDLNTVTGSASSALTVDTWYRIAWKVDPAGNSQTLYVYNGPDNSTPDQTLSGTCSNAGVTLVDEFRIGVITSGTLTTYWDEVHATKTTEWKPGGTDLTGAPAAGGAIAGGAQAVSMGGNSGTPTVGALVARGAQATGSLGLAGTPTVGQATADGAAAVGVGHNIGSPAVGRLILGGAAATGTLGLTGTAQAGGTTAGGAQANGLITVLGTAQAGRLLAGGVAATGTLDTGTPLLGTPQAGRLLAAGANAPGTGHNIGTPTVGGLTANGVGATGGLGLLGSAQAGRLLAGGVAANGTLGLSGAAQSGRLLAGGAQATGLATYLGTADVGRLTAAGATAQATLAVGGALDGTAQAGRLTTAGVTATGTITLVGAAQAGRIVAGGVGAVGRFSQLGTPTVGGLLADGADATGTLGLTGTPTVGRLSAAGVAAGSTFAVVGTPTVGYALLQGITSVATWAVLAAPTVGELLAAGVTVEVINRGPGETGRASAYAPRTPGVTQTAKARPSAATDPARALVGASAPGVPGVSGTAIPSTVKGTTT